MSIFRRGGTAAVAVVLLTLVGCGSRAASHSDLSELIELQNPRLTDVVVTRTESTRGDWITATGSATLVEDNFVEASFAVVWIDCDDVPSWEAWERTASEELTYMELVAPAGSRVSLAIELVPRKATDEQKRDDKSKVTSGGWTSGAGGGGFTYDEYTWGELRPRSRLSVDDVVLGSDEFNQICERALD